MPLRAAEQSGQIGGELADRAVVHSEQQALELGDEAALVQRLALDALLFSSAASAGGAAPSAASAAWPAW